MSQELLAAFALFAAITLFTPGPNNLMLMASGLNWGPTRTMPHLLGVCVGFSFMVLMVGAGFGQIFLTWPALYSVLKWCGAGYLLYLAWQIATSGPVDDGDVVSGRPMSFLEAALFQWVNAKAWVMAVGAVSAYGELAPFPWNIAAMATIFLIFGVFSSGAWTLFGQALRRVVSNGRRVRVFNGVMAALLVASLLPLAWS